MRRIAAWERWNGKRPHNRVVQRWERDARGRKTKRHIVGPWPEPVVSAVIREICSGNHDIAAEYQKARRPVPRPEDVQPLGLPVATIQRWHALLEQAGEDV